MTQKLLFVLSLFLLTIYASAQTRQIKGTVTDAATNAPLSGATIAVPQTNIATATDNSGQFFLQVPTATKTILVSMVNYQQQTVNVNGDGPFMITLGTDAKGMEEVVVVGYGTQKKK